MPGGWACSDRRSSETLDACLRDQEAQATQQYLVCEGALSPSEASSHLHKLLQLHSPQNIDYHGSTSAGLSYQKSWKISTYAFTSPASYVHHHLKMKYGKPCDGPLAEYLHQSGIRSTLDRLKSEFIKAKCRRDGADLSKAIEISQRMHLAQLFLTVQPEATQLHKLSTSLQPHFDPANLTINLHFSPLDFRGALPSENGIVVFKQHTNAEGSTAKLPEFVQTPQGAATFIWEDPLEDGEAHCFHTAQNLTRGARVVLCSFWRIQPQQGQAAGGLNNSTTSSRPQQKRKAGSCDLSACATSTERRIRRAVALHPRPLPLPIEPGQRVSPWLDGLQRKYFAANGFIRLFTASENRLQLSDAACQVLLESAQATIRQVESKGMLERIGNVVCADLLASLSVFRVLLEGPRGTAERIRCRPADYSTARQHVLQQSQESTSSCGFEVSRFVLHALPSVLRSLAPTSVQDLYLFNEQFVRVEPGRAPQPWQMDARDVTSSASVPLGMRMFSVWIPLFPSAGHAFEIVTSNAVSHRGGVAQGDDDPVTVHTQPGELVLLDGNSPFCHKPNAHPDGHTFLWNVQYTSAPVRVGRDAIPLAFEVPCARKKVADASGRSTSTSHLCTANGVEVSSSSNDPTLANAPSTSKMFFPLRDPGDAVFVRGGAWHRSRPSLDDRTVTKLVLFFKSTSTSNTSTTRQNVGTEHKQLHDLGYAVNFDAKLRQLCALAFQEVSCSWDDPQLMSWVDGSARSGGVSQQPVHDAKRSRACKVSDGSDADEESSSDNEEGNQELCNGIWTTYFNYSRVNMDQAGGENWQRNQLRNVRRVRNAQLPTFLHHSSVAATSKLISAAIEIVNKTREHNDFELYDLHFLRQKGANAASFCWHVDIQDTGDVATSRVSGALSVLLGGFVHQDRALQPSLAAATSKRLKKIAANAQNQVAWQQCFARSVPAALVQAATSDVVYAQKQSDVTSFIGGGAGLSSKPGCTCGPRGCKPGNCSCIDAGHVTVGTSRQRINLVECGRCCPCLCTENSCCRNEIARQVRDVRDTNGVKVHWRALLEVFQCSPGHHEQLGVRCRRTIAAGAIVAEYVGERITLDEARRRSQVIDDRNRHAQCGRDKSQYVLDGDDDSDLNAQRAGINFVLYVKEQFAAPLHDETSHAKRTGRSMMTCLDAGRVGNISRFFNHSCEPNMDSVYVDRHALNDALSASMCMVTQKYVWCVCVRALGETGAFEGTQCNHMFVLLPFEKSKLASN